MCFMTRSATSNRARPVQAEDASGVVVEDGDLVGTQFHALTVRGHVTDGKDLCRSPTRTANGATSNKLECLVIGQNMTSSLERFPP